MGAAGSTLVGVRCRRFRRATALTPPCEAEVPLDRVVKRTKLTVHASFGSVEPGGICYVLPELMVAGSNLRLQDVFDLF